MGKKLQLLFSLNPKQNFAFHAKMMVGKIKGQRMSWLGHLERMEEDSAADHF